MKHIDLFSGIGGFALAARWTGYETIVFCEKDEWCQRVLRKHWPDKPIIPDIFDFDGTKWRGATLLTGGFPCQPFSVAGKRRGKKDDRHLWPEMLRVISEARPNWVIGENVAGFADLGLRECLDDLERQNYWAQSFVIPAYALNLPTLERHLWIIAAASSVRCERSKNIKNKDNRIKRKFQRTNTRENNRWSLPSARVCRVGEGIPHRVDRLRGLGNAIIPQVAAEIMRAISFKRV